MFASPYLIGRVFVNCINRFRKEVEDKAVKCMKSISLKTAIINSISTFIDNET